MKWSELESLSNDSEARLLNLLSLSNFESGEWFGIEIRPDELSRVNFEDLFGDGAIKDLAIVRENVTAICNYMFEDGKIDMTKDLLKLRDLANELSIKAEKHRTFAISCYNIKRIIGDYLSRKGTPLEPLKQPIEANSEEIAGLKKPRKKKRVKAFIDIILMSQKEEILKRLHEKIDGQNADVAIDHIKHAIKNRHIMKPSWRTFKNEFADVEIPESTYYNKISGVK